MSTYEISKIITISTSHVSENSARLLDNYSYEAVSTNTPVVLKKYDYGWFIYVPEYYADYSIPEDIKKCMALAHEQECEWLCLDCDGEIVDELETFNW